MLLLLLEMSCSAPVGAPVGALSSLALTVSALEMKIYLVQHHPLTALCTKMYYMKLHQ